MTGTLKSIQRAMLPGDENGDVLRQMIDDGDDLTLPRDVAFQFVFAQREHAIAFADAARAAGELVVSEPTADDDIWEVIATRHMPALHAAITALEAELGALAQAHGGFPDGWSCMAVGGEAGDDEPADSAD